MNKGLHKLFTALTLLAAAGIGPADDDLDQALKKQKDKTVRRVYSEQAELDDLNLTVPRTPSEEDLELDRKLTEIESKLNTAPSPTAMQAPPQRRVPAMRRTEDPDQNWLLPDALGDDESAELDNAPGQDNWIAQEIERQNELREQERALEEESRQIDRMVRENLPGTDTASRELQRLDAYTEQPDREQRSLPGIPTYQTPQFGRSSSAPQPVSPFALPGTQTGRDSSQRSPSRPVSPFSIDSARSSSVFGSADETKSSSLFNSPFQPSSSDRQNAAFPNRTSGRDADAKSKSLTPLEQIRQSAPIHRDDPFSDNPSSRFKHSIWE